MQVNEIEQIEFELTSRCNAGCPNCPRTVILNNRGVEALELNTIRLSDIKQWLPNTTKVRKIKFSGNLGDAGVHPELYEIVAYFSTFAKTTQIKMHTNGGMQSEKFWRNLGRLSHYINTKADYRRFVINWAIDGLEDTNHIYRIGVKWNKVWNNLNAYLDAGGAGEWHFISFPHNEHQIEEVERIATAYGLKMVIRKGVRNKTEGLRASNNTHSQVDHPLNAKVTSKKEKVDLATQYAHTVSCMHLEQKSVFIASNNTLWPCCMLWDEHVQKQNMYKYMPDDPNWNNLNFHSFQDILDSSWYKDLQSFWTDNVLFRCVKSCGDGGKLKTEFTTKNYND